MIYDLHSALEKKKVYDANDVRKYKVMIGEGMNQRECILYEIVISRFPGNGDEYELKAIFKPLRRDGSIFQAESHEYNEEAFINMKERS